LTPILPSALETLWNARDGRGQLGSAAQCVRAAQALLRAGEPLLAFDLVQEGQGRWPQDPNIQMLEGLSLARSGAAERAHAVLAKLYAAGHRDEPTVAGLARAHKDLWQRSSRPDQQRHHLQRAEALYTEAFEAAKSVRYWSGINAATLALLNGQHEVAAARAREVQATAERLLAGAQRGAADFTAEHYWLCATLGEAALLLGDLPGATSWYREAAADSAQAHGDRGSTRRNAKLILAARGMTVQFLEECLPATRIVVFSGHMIDADGATLRFPGQSAPQAYAAIKQHLIGLQARIGYASAARGADILFLEAMLELGGEIHIVLPSDRESFIAASVATAGGMHWVRRFEAVMAHAKQVSYATQHSQGEVFLAYANLLLLGLAKSQARQIDGVLSALALWDGASGGHGGTASALRLWRDCGEAVHAIHPLTLAQQDLPAHPGGPGPSDTWLAAQSDTDPRAVRKLVSLLFADAVGFSQLDEQQVPLFVSHFLGRIAQRLAASAVGPIVRNTWGDALYLVFNDVAAAGRTALDLCELMENTDWAQLGLPKRLGIRIGLHCGPAYPVIDPIMERLNYTGVQVSRAARLEPIAPPGCVYASEAFAALAEVAGARDFVCEYVGQATHAKRYGVFPTYRLRRV